VTSWKKVVETESTYGKYVLFSVINASLAACSRCSVALTYAKNRVSIFLELYFFEKFDKNSPFFEKKLKNSIKAKNIFLQLWFYNITDY
jgi:hypothetical protein